MEIGRIGLSALGLPGRVNMTDQDAKIIIYMYICIYVYTNRIILMIIIM